ncbi:MAG TPA: AraC family transcriptional regulator [Syntrophomonadaceae bacterium]|nr:AraC family transcriptional regulator [Syntrophomonadaceae bacterium]HPR92501.1 AraC family transcriptional regulator [Syntrophomonadaceae bacterium]
MSADISEKISYLQGLSEGLNISEASPHGKIISGILAVLDEIAEAVTNMQCEFEDFKEYVESIDDDLFDLEENFLNDDEFVEMQCQHCGGEIYFESRLLNDDQEDRLEIICPHCNEVIFINDGSFDQEFTYFPDEMEDSSTNEHP